MKAAPLARLDEDEQQRTLLLQHCRLKAGEIWRDPLGRHSVGCLDAADVKQVRSLVGDERVRLAIHDPPYNLVAFEKRSIAAYIDWCRHWIQSTLAILHDDASCYVWLGADQEDGFQPLPEFMILMREFEELKPRSFITMRNQRGYGTQKNWMALRQELLFYVKGKPPFEVQYTDIPKILRGYYKEVGGKRTENLERGRSPNIRPGNVWVDIQQVFYRMEENVSGCYAQKPLKALERILAASSRKNDAVVDFFGHSGTTLIACERLGRRCFTCDTDPIFCEIMIRRLEHFRATGKTGWQNASPFDE